MAEVSGVLGAGRFAEHAWEARTEEWLAQVGLRSRGVALHEAKGSSGRPSFPCRSSSPDLPRTGKGRQGGPPSASPATEN